MRSLIYIDEPRKVRPRGVIITQRQEIETVRVIGAGSKCYPFAEYLIELPPKALLQQELLDAIELSR